MPTLFLSKMFGQNHTMPRPAHDVGCKRVLWLTWCAGHQLRLVNVPLSLSRDERNDHALTLIALPLSVSLLTPCLRAYLCACTCVVDAFGDRALVRRWTFSVEIACGQKERFANSFVGI